MIQNVSGTMTTAGRMLSQHRSHSVQRDSLFVESLQLSYSRVVVGIPPDEDYDTIVIGEKFFKKDHPRSPLALSPWNSEERDEVA